MSDDMVKQVAEAIRLCAVERGHPVQAVVVRHLAIAAIEAMREPTDAMCAAMARYYDDNYRKGHEREDTPARFIWQDMIDAALGKPG